MIATIGNIMMLKACLHTTIGYTKKTHAETHAETHTQKTRPIYDTSFAATDKKRQTQSRNNKKLDKQRAKRARVWPKRTDDSCSELGLPCVGDERGSQRVLDPLRTSIVGTRGGAAAPQEAPNFRADQKRSSHRR